MTTKPWPYIVFGPRRLSGIEARAVLEMLDVMAEIMYGRFDAALRTLTCNLTRKVKPAHAETVGQLLEQASQCLHPGRSSLRDDELSDLGMLIERLRRLAAADQDGYGRYHELLRERYKQRLLQVRETRRRERSGGTSA